MILKIHLLVLSCLDHVVFKNTKMAFDKFVKAKRTFAPMMFLWRSYSNWYFFQRALMKAKILELGIFTLEQETYKKFTHDEIREKIKNVDDERIFVIAEAIRRKIPIEYIHEVTKIDLFFLSKIKEIVEAEENLKTLKLEDFTFEKMKKIKKMGFTDNIIGKYIGCEEKDVLKKRKELGVLAVYKTVDTCAGEFESATPYYYSTYDQHCEIKKSQNKKVLVIGSGPIRIGQGIEFDYCSVHSIWGLKEEGYETIIANNNPETVSTDFDTADKLYFEPLTKEDVRNIVD